MSMIFKLITLVFIAIIFAFIASNHLGYIIIFLKNYIIEISLIGFILVSGLLFTIIYYFIRFWINLHRLPNKIRKYRIRNALVQSRNFLNTSGINYFEGKYLSAYNNALKSIKKETVKSNKFLALIIAFKSATLNRSFNNAEDLLEQINSYKDKKWQLIKHMVIAENQFLEGNYGVCVDNLNSILELDKKHIPAKKMMLKVFIQLNNYEKAFEVLNWLIKNNSLDTLYIQTYKLKILNGLFVNINEIEDLNKIYYSLDKKDQIDELIIKLYLESLIRLKEFSLVITQLKKMQISDQIIDKNLTRNLKYLAKKIDNEQNARELLLICEKALSHNRQNADLLLCLGILCFTLKLWANAKNYLEKSLVIKETLDTYLYLSFIAREMNDLELAKKTEKLLVNNIYQLG